MSEWHKIEEKLPALDEVVALAGNIGGHGWIGRGIYTGNSKRYRGFVLVPSAATFEEGALDALELTQWMTYSSVTHRAFD